MSGIFTPTKEKFSKLEGQTEQKILYLHTEDIRPNPHQPRVLFQLEELRALSDSIRQNGILQPLTVRQCGSEYELIAGERRLRAAKLAGLRCVPCIVMEINDRNSAILALVENIQRQDLNYFEEAAALEKLITYYGMTQEDAAMQLGRAQSTVANKLRLLRLTEKEKNYILENKLTERHARALLKLASPEERMAVLEKVTKLGLNVEKTEQFIEEKLGKVREQENFRKRSVLFRDVRLFTNTIQKAVETMQAAGIPADSKKMQFEDYIEYQIRIPLIKND
ncbi:MAG: ParB/RepB/Spo0J family partition protein [Oscillospiraceae bacterium]|nr:ParB/RepB/Spo0J family partition protein [Oscillospiraceae bacterium]MDE6776742.1 ParB/RepB/Spo0J family partition protein [Oscillospiraceae bacterium]MDE7093846.1 ParB/RepB/Spo0J family partition protein [Oscillospiraceae bacterium]